MEKSQIYIIKQAIDELKKASKKQGSFYIYTESTAPSVDVLLSEMEAMRELITHHCAVELETIERLEAVV
jgi:hypothetical protein